MYLWKIQELVDNNEVKSVVLKGQDNQKLEIRCDLLEKKLFGIKFDNKYMIDNLFSFFSEKFKYERNTYYVCNQLLERINEDIEEDCWDYAHSFDTLIEAMNDYKCILMNFDDLYDNYSLNVNVGIHVSSYKYTTPDNYTLEIHESGCLDSFTDICKNEDEFWGFIRALHDGYLRIYDMITRGNNG